MFINFTPIYNLNNGYLNSCNLFKILIPPQITRHEQIKAAKICVFIRFALLQKFNTAALPG